MASGLTNDWKGGFNGADRKAAVSRASTGEATAIRAHHFQRRDGSDPVGVSNKTKPMQAGQMMKLASSYRAA
jgi:hypothetical protein